MSDSISIRVPKDEFTSKMHLHQKKVFRAFDRKEARFFMLNWHRRARKITLAVNILIAEAYTHQNQVYTYIAPTKTQAVDIVWTDPNMLFKWLPEETYTKNEQKNDITIHPTGSKIRIRGADKLLESSRGIDSVGFILDEFAIFREQQYFWNSIVRPILSTRDNSWCFFTFTPKGLNECCEMFNGIANTEEWFKDVLPATKSGLISQEQLEKLKQTTPKAMFDQEYLCSFITEEEFTFITSAMLEKLPVEIHLPYTKKIVSCDPSGGGDRCVIYAFTNTRIVDERIVHYKDPYKIAFECVSLARVHEIKDFIVDCGGGWGGGVVSGIEKLLPSSKVQSFDPGGKQVSLSILTHFANRKSEAWWYASEEIRANRAVKIYDLELIKELTAVRYRPDLSKLICVPKTDTKKLIGQSPDKADAYIMGLWGLKDASNYETKDKYRRSSSSTMEFNPMTV